MALDKVYLFMMSPMYLKSNELQSYYIYGNIYIEDKKNQA